MTKWSNICFLLSCFLLTSFAQYNPYQQRYQYGNNNMNNNLPMQQPNRQYGANNNQRFNQAGQPIYPNQQQQSQQYYQQQQQMQPQQQHQMNYGQNAGMNQYGQNQYQSNQGNRNNGNGAGLLGNPVRTSNSAFGNSSSPDGRATFGIRIASYSIGRVDLTSCTLTPCSYSFSIVMATLQATVNYESSNFYPLNGTTLADGAWRDEILINVTTKPISVDVFVHSRGLTIGTVDGNYSLGVPVTHVNTFVLDLRNYVPYGSNGTITRTTADLQDSKPTGQMGQTGGNIRLEYYVQCLNGYLGPNCDYTCTKVSTNIAQCTSAINPNEKHSCKYDSGFTQIAKDSCDYCAQGFANNGSCLPVGYVSGDVGVSHAYKVWTIVLACLLALALLLLLLLVLLKIISDSRNRRAQQYPQNRQQSTYTAYRPNAGSGETPLLGGTEKEWERERRPVAVQRAIPPHADVDSTQNSEDNRGPGYAQNRREAQV